MEPELKANWQRTVLRAMRAKEFTAEVINTTEVTHRYRRVTLSAPEFLTASQLYPTYWIRLWVPNLAGTKLVQRGYTLVDPDPASGTFSIDFVLHTPDGAAAKWGRHIQPGARVNFTITPSPLAVDAAISTYLLVGDSTALPAIHSLLTALPDGAKSTVLLIADGDERSPKLASDKASQWSWVEPDGEHATLTQELAALDLTGGFVWAAGERTLLKPVKAAAKGWEIARNQQHIQTYWIRGKESG